MSRWCGRGSTFLLLAGALSVSSLMGVWNFTAAQVGLESRLVITQPDKALIATKNFSLRDGKVILDDRATARTVQVVTINPDGTTTSDSSSDSEPGRFAIQNNLPHPAEIDITPDQSTAPAGVRVCIEPPGANIRPGASSDFLVWVRDSAVPAGDETFDFIIPVEIEASWEQGSADLRVSVPARVLRRTEERVIPAVPDTAVPGGEGSGEAAEKPLPLGGELPVMSGVEPPEADNGPTSNSESTGSGAPSGPGTAIEEADTGTKTTEHTKEDAAVGGDIDKEQNGAPFEDPRLNEKSNAANETR